MQKAVPVNHLSFLSSYEDDKRAEYAHALVRVLAADDAHERGNGEGLGWRISQDGDPDDATVEIKLGYVQKLVNEGVVRKVNTEDLTDEEEFTYYRLDVPASELVAEVRAVSERLDRTHRNLLKDLPYW